MLTTLAFALFTQAAQAHQISLELGGQGPSLRYEHPVLPVGPGALLAHGGVGYFPGFDNGELAGTWLCPMGLTWVQGQGRHHAEAGAQVTTAINLGDGLAVGVTSTPSLGYRWVDLEDGGVSLRFALGGRVGWGTTRVEVRPELQAGVGWRW